MSEDEEAYQDDFFESSRNQFEEFDDDVPLPRTSSSHGSRNRGSRGGNSSGGRHSRGRDNREVEEDEQHAQKINGKIESLQQRVEELENELTMERQQGLEIRKQYENELQSAWQKQTDAEAKNDINFEEETNLKAEVEKYRAKCDYLQEKLDIALLTDSGKSISEKLPLVLEEAFQSFCEKNKINDESRHNKMLTIQDCVKILNDATGRSKSAESANGKSKKHKQSSQESLDGKSISSGDTESMKQSSTGGPSGRLIARIKHLENELRSASNATEDTEMLRNRITALTERIRTEKEQRRQLEIEGFSTRKKIDMLGDHIEKLVLHLKREGAHKLRLAEQCRLAEKESNRNRDKLEAIQRKSAVKDRLILELREGSKVLEDQLRLMDEKYLELRSKLDWARAMAARKIKRAEKDANDLRVKFAMYAGNASLDHISTGSRSAPMSTGNSGVDDGGLDGGGHSAVSFNLDEHGYSIARKGRKGRNSRSGDNGSVNSAVSFRSNLSMDDVLEKIRVQQGAKREWTEEKIKKLVEK